MPTRVYEYYDVVEELFSSTYVIFDFGFIMEKIGFYDAEARKYLQLFGETFPSSFVFHIPTCELDNRRRRKQRIPSTKDIEDQEIRIVDLLDLLGSGLGGKGRGVVLCGRSVMRAGVAAAPSGLPRTHC